MTTDSTAATVQSSSRLTIDSSSSIARSKLSVFTSTWVFSAIIAFPGALFVATDSRIFLRAYCGGNSRAHQCGDMGPTRLFQALQVVTTFEHRDNPAAGA